MIKIWSILFLLKLFECDKLHHSMKKIKYFALNYVIELVSKLNYASKAVDKKKWAGLKI